MISINKVLLAVLNKFNLWIITDFLPFLQPQCMVTMYKIDDSQEVKIKNRTNDTYNYYKLLNSLVIHLF